MRGGHRGVLQAMEDDGGAEDLPDPLADVIALHEAAAGGEEVGAGEQAPAVEPMLEADGISEQRAREDAEDGLDGALGGPDLRDVLVDVALLIEIRDLPFKAGEKVEVIVLEEDPGSKPVV